VTVQEQAIILKEDKDPAPATVAGSQPLTQDVLGQLEAGQTIGKILASSHGSQDVKERLHTTIAVLVL
jgi:hypothetical protein